MTELMTEEAALSILEASLPAKMLINGRWTAGATGEVFEKLNPVTERGLALIPSGGDADVNQAIAAARAQFDGGEWTRVSNRDRGRLLFRLAELIDRDTEILAALQVLESGQPLREPLTKDIPASIEIIRYYAGWADKMHGSVIPLPAANGRPAHAYTVREPVGVLGMIIPWNGQTMISSWKLAPALAMGCTVVIKPSEEGQLALLHLGSLIEEAGFPAGVVNIVTGLGATAGAALAGHPGVDKVSFTGSPQTGRRVYQAAGAHFTPVTLELGGKTPQIIWPDADFQRAVETAAVGMFANQGQICASGSRILAHRSVYEAVVEGLADEANRITLGTPFDKATQMGSLINANQMDRVLGYIDIGRQQGARVVAGGERGRDTGYFVKPTIFADADPKIRIAQEEIFGPVGTVIPFDIDEEAVAIANGTPYRLGASLWTRDVSRAHLLASQMKAGAVWVNCWGVIDPALPWGGSKLSGMGREMGYAGLEDCTEEKAVAISL